MATVVCQGLQSCLESQLMESRILRLKLSSSKTHFHNHHHQQHQHIELTLRPSNFAEKLETEIPDFGGWSVLQALSTNPKDEKQQPYVPPHITKSTTTLSEKSLELCTENIGNETGTDIIVEDNIFSSSSSCTLDSKNSNKQKKAPRSRNFPPPLTSMSGLDSSLRVRAHREEGRLIIKAIKTPRMKCHFEVERSNDRLQIRLLEEEEEEEKEEEGLSYVVVDNEDMSSLKATMMENDVCRVS